MKKKGTAKSTPNRSNSGTFKKGVRTKSLGNNNAKKK